MPSLPQLPAPFRAAVGLVATVLDEAKHFPDKAIELPMLAVSSALQASLRAQQRYARLTARGDEVLAGRAGDEPPGWATFDEPVVPPPGGSRPRKTIRPPRSTDGTAPSAFDAIGDE
jgi:hypothetical protein